MTNPIPLPRASLSYLVKQPGGLGYKLHSKCSKCSDPLEFEVRENAEGAALSSRTACSGAFCASKQYQSILSSIQRLSAVPYASQLQHCVPPGEPKSCAIRAPFDLDHSTCPGRHHGMAQ